MLHIKETHIRGNLLFYSFSVFLNRCVYKYVRLHTLTKISNTRKTIYVRVYSQVSAGYGVVYSRAFLFLVSVYVMFFIFLLHCLCFVHYICFLMRSVTKCIYFSTNTAIVDQFKLILENILPHTIHTIRMQ